MLPCNTLLNILYLIQDAHSPDTYIQRVQEALDILRENVPRALVNVVPYFDITPVKDMGDSFMCKAIQM